MLPQLYFTVSTSFLLSHLFINSYHGYISPVVFNGNIYRLIFAIIAPLVIATRGLKKKSLDASGYLAALLVGFPLTYANLGFFCSLLTFFLVGSKATRFKSSVKKTFEADHKEGEGQRNWVQVLCNGGIPAQLAVLYLLVDGPKECSLDFRSAFHSSFLSLAVISSLSCCLGDTLASEIGSVSTVENPRLITTMRAVPRGTNGAISANGVLCSIGGGFLIGASYCVPGLLFTNASLYSAAVATVSGTLSGLIGSLLDSLLGATIQFSGLCRKTGKIVEVPGSDVEPICGLALCNNHSVNLISSAVTAIFIPFVAQHFLSVVIA